MGISHCLRAGTVLCTPALLVLAGSSAVAKYPPIAGRAMHPAPAGKRPTSGGTPAAKRCGSTQIARSTCMIELILADLKAHYDGIGGGGITRITAGASMSYAVELPQEERSDILTYQFERRGDEIVLKSRKASVISY